MRGFIDNPAPEPTFLWNGGFADFSTAIGSRLSNYTRDKCNFDCQHNSTCSSYLFIPGSNLCELHMTGATYGLLNTNKFIYQPANAYNSFEPIYDDPPTFIL